MVAAAQWEGQYIITLNRVLLQDCPLITTKHCLYTTGCATGCSPCAWTNNIISKDWNPSCKPPGISAGLLILRLHPTVYYMRLNTVQCMASIMKTRGL